MKNSIYSWSRIKMNKKVVSCHYGMFSSTSVIVWNPIRTSKALDFQALTRPIIIDPVYTVFSDGWSKMARPFYISTKSSLYRVPVEWDLEQNWWNLLKRWLQKLECQKSFLPYLSVIRLQLNFIENLVIRIMKKCPENVAIEFYQKP